MTTFKPHPNNVSTTLASAHAPGSGSLALAAGTGGAFGSVFPMMVVVATAATVGTPGEVNTIFNATARSGDTLTVSGAAEGTTDRAFAIGDTVEVRWTNGTALAIEGAVNALENTVVYTSGSYSDPAWITALSGTKITGNIAGNAASITGSITTSQISNLSSWAGSAAIVTLGTITTGTWTGAVINKTYLDATLVNTAGSYSDPAWITALSGTKITTGTVSPARLGTGTAGANNWLRGDGSWGLHWQTAGLKTTNYTMQVNDSVVIVDPTAGSFTLTLPPATAAQGREYLVTNNQAHPTNQVTIQRQGTDIIGAAASVVLSCTTQFKFIRLICWNSGSYVVTGSN